MFAYFEKKYFFPALWSLVAGTQWVGAMTGIFDLRFLIFDWGKEERSQNMGAEPGAKEQKGGRIPA
jgi:hypothetical protein